MSALQKIAQEAPLIPSQDLRQAAAMNAFFVLPAEPGAERFEVDPLRMFPTHPPLARRLERLGELAPKLGQARGMPPRPEPVQPAKQRSESGNPQALAAFFLAVVVWGMLAGLILTKADTTSDGLVWIPLLGSLAFFGGIVLGLQGVGRASAGAGGMGYAVTGLVLLLGPWILAALVVVLVAVLALLGVQPPSV
jgi:hypothetical protein